MMKLYTFCSPSILALVVADNPLLTALTAAPESDLSRSATFVELRKNPLS